MSDSRDVSPIRASEIRRLYERKVADELAKADAIVPGSDLIHWRGDLLATVAVLKGAPGPSEACGGAAVSGADGTAAVAGLEALGHDPSAIFYALTRPVDGSRGDLVLRVRLLVEAIDAPLVLALDPLAASDIAEAFALAPLRPGETVQSGGRSFVALDGLEAALADDTAKKRVWRQMSAAKRRGPIY